MYIIKILEKQQHMKRKNYSSQRIFVKEYISIICDEPLKFINVLLKIQIENFILEYSPTVIFVKYDRIFSKKIATKVVEI